MRVSLPKVKRQLAAVWFSGAAILFVVVFVQTLFGRYGERAGDAWGWLLPTILPTLSLIIGVVAKDALASQKARGTVDAFVARLALVLSAAYLLTVSSTLLLSPWAELNASLTPLALMELSHFWLAPFQGLVTAALGAFFVSRGEG